MFAVTLTKERTQRISKELSESQPGYLFHNNIKIPRSIYKAHIPIKKFVYVIDLDPPLMTTISNGLKTEKPFERFSDVSVRHKWYCWISRLYQLSNVLGSTLS